MAPPFEQLYTRTNVEAVESHTRVFLDRLHPQIRSNN
jgi:hypothetical protein